MRIPRRGSHSGGPRFSVVVGTANRAGLRRAIRSSRWADEIVVVFDAEEAPWHPRGCVVFAEGPTRTWGHAQRNRGMIESSGTHLAFMDDDDHYTTGAGRSIRTAVTADPDRVHVFCMRNREAILSGPVEPGKISTQMFVVPRDPISVWGSRYEGDFDFISETLRLRGDEPIFHSEVIAVYRPPLGPSFASRLRAIRRSVSLRLSGQRHTQSGAAGESSRSEDEPDDTTIDP